MIKHGTWVWSKQSLSAKDSHVFLRYEHKLQKPAHSIRLDITASDHYKLYCNGVPVGQGPCPATPAYYYYDTYELGTLENSLCLAVHAYSIGTAEMVTQQNQGLPGILFAATITYTDGSHETVYSSTQCKVCVPPQYFHDYIAYDEARLSKWGGFEEVYLSHKADGDFYAVGYDDEHWEQAVQVPKAAAHFSTLLAREIPMLVYGVARPHSVLQTEAYLGDIQYAEHALCATAEFAIIDASVPQSYPSVVFDFGKQVVGTPVFDLQGSRGASMRVLYGESLDMMRMDTLIMCGQRQQYRPYQRRAFRFLKLAFNNSVEPILLHHVFVETERYPYEHQSSFACSDEVLNRIYETSIETVQHNAQTHFEDCVVREKMQWLADARVMSLVAYWNFNDAALSKKAIAQFFRIQQQSGLIPSAGPQAMNSNNVDFCLHFVLMLYEYFFYTADDTLVQEYAEQLRHLMAFFARMEGEDGLLRLTQGSDAQAFLDWASIDKREFVTILNCMYVEVLRKAAILLELIGTSEYDALRTKALQLMQTLEARCWNEEKQLLCDCTGSFGQSHCFSEQSNLCAVAYRAVSQKTIKKILCTIQKPLSAEVETIKGAFFLSFALEGMLQEGEDKAALIQMRGFWGEMLARGATTWWETFDVRTPHTCIPDLFSENSATSYISYIPCSHSHGWGAGPAYLLPRYVLGIEPVSAGFRKVRIAPHVGDLQWAQGSVHTPMGVIAVEWKRKKNGEMDVQVTLPSGVERVGAGI